MIDHDHSDREAHNHHDHGHRLSEVNIRHATLEMEL